MRLMTFLLLAAAAAFPLALVLLQSPFAETHFEFDREQDFFGIVQPIALPTVALNDGSSAVLVGTGKRGYVLSNDVRPGARVSFTGKLIEGRGNKLIEVASPLRAISAQHVPDGATPVQVEIQGEIVDSKCFVGVMNPGSGKVHRGCAARCLHGGIPPALVSQNGDLYYLLDSAGEPILPGWASSHAGEQFIVQGPSASMSGMRVLWIHTARPVE
jgi:hypothetical protein